jgi:hypothetical protein
MLLVVNSTHPIPGSAWVWSQVQDEKAFEDYIASWSGVEYPDGAGYFPQPEHFTWVWVPDEFELIDNNDPRDTWTEAEKVEMVNDCIDVILQNTDAWQIPGYPYRDPQEGSQWSGFWGAIKTIRDNYDGTGAWPTWPLAPDGFYHV